MSRSVAQRKDDLLASCLPVKTNLEPTLRLARPAEQTELGSHEKPDVSIQCLLRAIKVGGAAGLLARINYYFPKAQGASVLGGSVKQAFRHADALNHCMGNSRVFVVQDLDGDRGYYLRMDAVLNGRYERRNLTKFLEGLCQDVDVFRRYFGCSFSAISTLGSTCHSECETDVCEADIKVVPSVDLGSILALQTHVSA
ncbi:MAG: hypothetical protein AAGC93_02590 [Cyanobacteria bacterium P01_F01_bin.53]